MLKSTLHQYPDLFEDSARHWRRLTGGQLFIYSPRGDSLSNVDHRLPGSSWDTLQKRIPSQDPVVFTEDGRQILAVPLAYDDQLLGYLISLDASDTFLQLLIWLADSLAARLTDLYAMQGMTDELIGAWNQLELVYRVTENLTLTSDLPTVLRSTLNEIQKVANTEDSFIILDQADALLCVTATERHEPALQNSVLLKNLEQAGRVMFCSDRTACLDLWPEASADVENMLATQLPNDDSTSSAAIGLINKTKHNFTAGDVKLLAALAQQVATIINSHQTHRRLIVEERLRRELEIAAEIQGSLRPAKLPQIEGLSLAACSLPASEVGGDFYDFIDIDDRYLIVMIGDVSGKGVPAAMLTSVTRTMLRVEAMRNEPPHRIIQQANHVLYPDLERAASFVTVLVAIIDAHEGKMTYASAGHTPALLWRTKTRVTEQLYATSLPIGISGSLDSQSKVIDLNPGDVLVFYTDGITEAQSPSSDLFGVDQLIYLVESRANEPPEQLQCFIRNEIDTFRQQAPWQDDMTLIVVKSIFQPKHPTLENTGIIKQVDFLYPADMDHLSAISRQIAGTCRELRSLPDDSNGEHFIHLIELAISEICTNIVKHAYAGSEGKISGQVTLLNNGVQLDFFDQGVGFDPNEVPIPKADPHNLKEGGYGLHIVRQIMDVVSYESVPGEGNHWHLMKLLPNISSDE